MTDTQEKRWYVTFGVPGGEYAVKSETDAIAAQIIDKLLTFLVDEHYEEYTASGRMEPDTTVFYRPAPPETAAWLEQYVAGGMWSTTGSGRRIVPGGWLILYTHQTIERNDQWGMEFVTAAASVPVALTRGITVISEDAERGYTRDDRELIPGGPDERPSP
jgi:hypothetical protein